MIKKVSLFLVMMLFSLMSVNALTELSACGKNSAWTPGETYNITFTEIPSGYANTYCFQIIGSEDDLNFVGNNQVIENKKSGLQFFDVRGSTVTTFSGWNVSNFTLKSVEGAKDTGTLFYTQKSAAVVNGGTSFTGATISNVNVFDMGNVWQTSSATASGTMSVVSNTFDDVYFIVDQNIFNQGGACASGANTNYNSNTFTNSVLISKQANLDDGNSNCGNRNFQNNLFTNNVIRAKNVGRLIGGTGSNYDNNLISNDPLTTYPTANITNEQTTKTLQDIFWIENTDVVLTSTNNADIVPINQENLSVTNGFELAGTSGNTLDISFVTFPDSIEFTSATGISLGDNTLKCDFVTCLTKDTSTTVLGSSESAAQIEFQTDSKILDQLHTRQVTATNDIRYISGGTVTRNNVTIANVSVTYNLATASDSDYTTTGSREIVKASVNNLDLNNVNITFSGDNDANHTAFDITATNPNSNDVTENRFVDLRAGSDGKAYVFNLNGDVRFFNNNLGADVELSRISLGGLNASPQVYYAHSNGNIYLYQLGNFYSDNGGCVDGNSDGLCDSSYTSGATTDFFPLASYPFDYEGNILFALETITNSSIVVNLNAPSDLQSFNLADGTSTINLSFTQTSQFDDLTCDYIVDGASIQTVTNIASGSTESVLANGWTTGNHTFRVECANEVAFGISTEITIETIVGSGGSGGSGNETGSGDPIGDNELGLGSGSEIIDVNSPTNTVDNILTVVGNMGAFLFNIIIPALILLSIVGAFFVMVVLLR